MQEPASRQAASKDVAVPPDTPEHSSEPPPTPTAAAIPQTLASPQTAHGTPLGTPQPHSEMLASTPQASQGAAVRAAEAVVAPADTTAGISNTEGHGSGTKQHGSAKKRRADAHASTGKRARKHAQSDSGSNPVQQAAAAATPLLVSPARSAKSTEKSKKGVKRPSKGVVTAESKQKAHHKHMSMSSVKAAKAPSHKQKQRRSL